MVYISFVYILKIYTIMHEEDTELNQKSQALREVAFPMAPSQQAAQVKLAPRTAGLLMLPSSGYSMGKAQAVKAETPTLHSDSTTC